MSGIPGMKGGGGSRPGAGRPKKDVLKLDIGGDSDPKQFLLTGNG